MRKQYSGSAVEVGLQSDIGPGDMTFFTDDATGYPDGSVGPFVVSIGLGRAEEEKILVASREGTEFTVQERGYDGSTPSSHGQGRSVTHVIDAETLNEANAHVNNAIANPHPQYAQDGHTHSEADINGLDHFTTADANAAIDARVTTGFVNLLNVDANTIDGFDSTDLSKVGHTHDDRYYTESQVDSMLANKAESTHTHSAADITSGTFTSARISQASVRQHINKSFVDGLGINATALEGNTADDFAPAGHSHAATESFPPGGIIMWSGTVATIPAGWALCDGANNTPDLRDRFIVGAGSSYAAGETGGEAEVTLSSNEMPAHYHAGPSHTHAGPSHTHSGPNHRHASGTYSASGAGSHTHTYSRAIATNSSPTGAGSLYVVSTGTGTTDTGGSHTHDVAGWSEYNGTQDTGASGTGQTSAAGTGATSVFGGGEPHENRPPYYALALIMKL